MTTESVQTPNAYAALVTVETGVDLDIGTVFIEPTTAISGIVQLYDNNSTWDASLPSWEPAEIVATNEDGLEPGEPPPTKWVVAFDLTDGTWALMSRTTAST